MKALLLGVLYILLSAQQCAQETDTEALLNKWMHSHEEDAAGVQVYRPYTFDFPLARGRDGFEFKKDGQFIQYDIAPVDGNIAVKGTWQQDKEKKNVITIELAKEKNSRYRMEIVEVNKEVLKVKKMYE